MDRPITGTGQYNLNFIDWENEWEEVLDHANYIRCKNETENRLNYEENPYFDVARITFEEFLTEDEFGVSGITDTEIDQLIKYQGPPKECSICLEVSSEGLLLPCNHVFHSDCIQKWLRSRKICPNCRQPVVN